MLTIFVNVIWCINYVLVCAKMNATSDEMTEQQQCINDQEDNTVDAADPLTAPGQTTAAGHDDDTQADSEETSGVRQRAMYARFRSWTLRNYGETGKTKTVTRAKYERVVAILSGAEPPTADNSKLRFWIKAKGFRLGYPLDTDPPTIVNRGELYIPSKSWVRVMITALRRHIVGKQALSFRSNQIKIYFLSNNTKLQCI